MDADRYNDNYTKDIMIDYLCAMWAAHIMIAKGITRAEAKKQCHRAAIDAVMNGWVDELDK
jgi:hypothetical protein